ncbi:hypothetical protein GCM10010174_61770 [Kutzneria viridogrisea]|uniref:Uncharacterized protein n=1 Tax=Kutzneria viridogrisea TaxID=47990 RepID=A0ABR6BG98_9PSEU|nr:hypothetical protein [Kutzneria viridogrisea]
MTTDAADILTRAADVLTSLGARATYGTWSATDLTEHGHTGVWWVQHETHDDDGTTYGVIAELDTMNCAANAAWIAAMEPEAVTVHLAQALRLTAAALADPALATQQATVSPLLALARHILSVHP